MDVPTRNAYVQGVVAPDERSAANGVTNVVRSLGASAGPYLAELCYASPQYRNYPFYVAGGLKIVYDVLLLQSFHSVKPASELQNGYNNTSSSSNGLGPVTVAHQYKAIHHDVVNKEDIEAVQRK